MFFAVVSILLGLILLGIVYLLYNTVKKLDAMKGLLDALGVSVNRLDWHVKDQADSFQNELAHMNDLINGRYAMLTEGIEMISDEIVAMEDRYSDIYEQFKFCHEQLDRIDEKLEAMKQFDHCRKKLDRIETKIDKNRIRRTKRITGESGRCWKRLAV